MWGFKTEIDDAWEPEGVGAAKSASVNDFIDGVINWFMGIDCFEGFLIGDVSAESRS